MRASEVTPGRYRFEFEACGQIHHRDVTVFDDPQLGRVMQFDGADSQKMPLRHIDNTCSFVAIEPPFKAGDWVVCVDATGWANLEVGSMYYVAQTDDCDGVFVKRRVSDTMGYWILANKFRQRLSVTEHVASKHQFDRGCLGIHALAGTVRKLDYTDRYCELAPLVAEAYAFCKCEDFSSATDVLDRARQIISPPAWPQVIR